MATYGNGMVFPVVGCFARNPSSAVKAVGAVAIILGNIVPEEQQPSIKSE